MMQLNVGDELLDALKLGYAAKQPLLLSGPTGIGKSQIAKRAAKDLGIGFIARDLSLMEAPDLAGIPIISGGEMRYAIPQFLPKAGSGQRADRVRGAESQPTTRAHTRAGIANAAGVKRLQAAIGLVADGMHQSVG
jgi:DNA polymerase III delta prime subunit